jgi:unspecific monooxygenase
LPGRDIAKALRENALLAFPPEAFEEDVIVRSFLGRQQIILNQPQGIHHILVENPENYRRTAATIRMLRPLLGNGLLLSEGEEWKYQRRTLAPAFAPRTIPLLTRHVARAADAVVAQLTASAEHPLDLLTVMRSLALEIAGTSMFSLGMERFRPEMRDLISGYTAHLGRPTLLDFLLPLAIPSPRDFARRRVRRRWMKLIRQIIAERRRLVSEAAPHDLFDLLSTARDPESGAPFSPEGLADQVATMISAGHETTGLALFWSLYLVAAAPAVQQRIAAEAAALDLGPEGAVEALPRLVYTRAVVHDRAAGAQRGYRRRHQGARPCGGVHRALGIAQAPPAVGATRSLRPDKVSSRCPAPRSLRLSAVRYRTARLHRRPVRSDRGHLGPSQSDPGLRYRARR